MDSFLSTSVRDRALQKSSKVIFPVPERSASTIVLSTIDIRCSWSIFSPTIICRILSSSSREIRSSSSRSYILKANFNLSSRLLSLILFGFGGLKRAKTFINCLKLTRSSLLSIKKACTIRSHRGFIANSGILRKSSGCGRYTIKIQIFLYNSQRFSLIFQLFSIFF